VPTDEEGSKCGVRIRTGGRASYTRPSMHARGTWTHRWKASSARPVQKIAHPPTLALTGAQASQSERAGNKANRIPVRGQDPGGQPQKKKKQQQ
jgi:hypothetical protein